MERYRLFDHTADVGVELFGKGREELFSNAGVALTDIIFGGPGEDKGVVYRFEVKSPGIEMLLVKYLSELSYIMQVRRLVPARFTVKFTGEDHLACSVSGEEFDPSVHGYQTEVKTVTYHKLTVERRADGSYYARVILDV
ncbi:archease [bacterium]|nr:archease [bacterium]